MIARIYKVEIDDGSEGKVTRLVQAASPAHAVRFVASRFIHASPIKTTELGGLMMHGIKIEDATGTTMIGGFTFTIEPEDNQ